MKILVFDTETTGILPKIITNINNCPHILQLSYIVYDLNKYKIEEEYNKIIHVPQSTIINKECISIHGITKIDTQKSKTTIFNSLKNFNKKVNDCQVIIGHNIDFDMKMINIECKRYNMDPIFPNKNKNILCTMKEGIDLCKIVATNSKGTYYKWPKLSELHEYLFNKKPNNLHDAYNDILVCLRCAVFILNKTDICTKDSVFKRKIKNLFNN